MPTWMPFMTNVRGAGLQAHALTDTHAGHREQPAAGCGCISLVSGAARLSKDT
jgi:hypothetical protein